MYGLNDNIHDDHPQRNKVSYLIRNLREIPLRIEGQKQLYNIYYYGKPIGVGESEHIPAKIRGRYVWCIRTMKPDGSAIIKYMQREASRVNALGKIYHFEVEYVYSVDAAHARSEEANLINFLQSQGHQILNRPT